MLGRLKGVARSSAPLLWRAIRAGGGVSHGHPDTNPHTDGPMAWRRKGIGSSDAAAVAGLTPITPAT